MFSHKNVQIYKDVTKEAVWKAWINVVNWPRWDEELDYCDIDGEFEVDNSFILKPKGGPKLRIYLPLVEENKRFLDYCKFPGAKMFDDHQIFDDNDGVRIEHHTYVKGPLAFLWWHLVAKKVAYGIPQQTENLIQYVRAQHD
jgi:hypothetical protein